MRTHAALPVAQHLAGDRFRVYCSGRDEDGRAQEGYVEIDLNDPARTLAISDEPVIHVGELGTFDDRGSLSSWIVERSDLHYHYFTGVMLGQTVPFYYGIGLAISRDGGRTTEKVSSAPILDRNEIDPYLTASPCVLVEGDLWRMWYMSGTAWKMEDGRPKHFYLLKYAESSDGITWRRDGHIAIDYQPGEYAISRPSVLKDPASGRYCMWFASRGHKYRIGYAESADGFTWTRKDEEAGIDVSADGWDDDMLCYPYVFDHGGERFMLYNGNDYGRTGIGLARLVR